MTVRAILIGFVLAALIAAFGYINDEFMNVDRMVCLHFPLPLFGLLVLTTAVVLPLIRRVRGGWGLKPGELATALLLAMVGCSIPGGGLLKLWFPAMVSPLTKSQEAGWKGTRVLDYAPSKLVPEPRTADSPLIESYLTAAPGPDQYLSVDEIPWAAWWPSVRNWLPMILLVGLGVFSLSLVVHHQWANNERLKYPIAEVARAYITGDDGQGRSLFAQKSFWIGAAVVFSIHLINGLATWFPNQMISIPTSLSLQPIADRFPSFKTAQWNWDYFRAPIFFTVIAFGFFLASDISLTLGVSTTLYILVISALATAGVDVTYSPIRGGVTNWTAAGAALALTVLILYTGRRHYAGVLVAALTFRRRPDVPLYAAVAGRLFLLSAAGATAVLTWYGLQWPLAIMFVVALFVFFLACSRLSAECGQLLVKPAWEIPCLFAGLVGLSALGPEAIILIGLMNAVFGADVREALMPFFINGLKVCSDLKVPTGRAAAASGSVWVLCLAIGAPVCLWAIHNYGGDRVNWWSRELNATAHYQAAMGVITDLTDAGTLPTVNAWGPLERLSHARPQDAFLWAAGIGAAGVLLLGYLRLRWTWWPLHPLLFLVGGSWPLGLFGWSFLLGWFVKSACVRMGGSSGYQKGKTFMYGVIAGDLFGALAMMTTGYVYFFAKGLTPPRYWVFP